MHVYFDDPIDWLLGVQYLTCYYLPRSTSQKAFCYCEMACVQGTKVIYIYTAKWCQFLKTQLSTAEVEVNSSKTHLRLVLRVQVVWQPHARSRAANRGSCPGIIAGGRKSLLTQMHVHRAAQGTRYTYNTLLLLKRKASHMHKNSISVSMGHMQGNNFINTIYNVGTSLSSSFLLSFLHYLHLSEYF